MKEYKYYFRATDEYGHVFFDHRSNYAYKLLAMARRESTCSDGSTSARWYFAKVETNITEDIQYRVYQGERI